MTPDTQQRRSNAGKRAIIAAWRRVRIARLSAEGLDSNAIAARLGINRNTVTDILKAQREGRE